MLWVDSIKLRLVGVDSSKVGPVIHGHGQSRPTWAIHSFLLAKTTSFLLAICRPHFLASFHLREAKYARWPLAQLRVAISAAR